MRRLVVIPSDSKESLLRTGSTLEMLETQYNPDYFFDKVYNLCPHENNETCGTIEYISTEYKDIGKYLKDLKPDVVRGIGGTGSLYAIANRIEGVPVVISTHSTDWSDFTELADCADYVMCVSHIVRRIAIDRFGVLEGNTGVIYNCVDSNM